ncbi:uncharacterized protein LOC111266350 isoform X2 [Varroa jacobsoni]|uniref:uncharacterized protein LOC111266350 isoform X2 n=1 Tax=Varroa jacobsoni TaxID=62625 RepID=UPI000BF8338A|nr:uncharacterized protein LOC111266350 isoform X2 [Varroa jacobsoni]
MHLKALSLLYMFVGTNAAASDGHLWVPRGTRGFESLCPASADPRIGTWNNGNMSESSLFKHVSLEQAILLAGETVLTRSLHKAYSQIMFRVGQSDQQVLAKLSALQTAVLPNPGQKKRNKLQHHLKHGRPWSLYPKRNKATETNPHIEFPKRKTLKSRRSPMDDGQANDEQKSVIPRRKRQKGPQKRSPQGDCPRGGKASADTRLTYSWVRAPRLPPAVPISDFRKYICVVYPFVEQLLKAKADYAHHYKERLYKLLNHLRKLTEDSPVSVNKVRRLSTLFNLFVNPILIHLPRSNQMCEDGQAGVELQFENDRLHVTGLNNTLWDLDWRHGLPRKAAMRCGNQVKYFGLNDFYMQVERSDGWVYVMFNEPFSDIIPVVLVRLLGPFLPKYPRCDGHLKNPADWRCCNVPDKGRPISQ